MIGLVVFKIVKIELKDSDEECAVGLQLAEDIFN